MPTYTIVGVYTEPLGQRYATTVEADSPEKAEAVALRACAEANGVEDSGLMVAAVIPGAVELLDMYTDGYSFGIPGRDTA